MLARPEMQLPSVVLRGERVIASIFMASLVTMSTRERRHTTPITRSPTGMERYGMATQITTSEKQIWKKVHKQRVTVLGTIISRMRRSFAKRLMILPTGFSLKKETLARMRRLNIAL